MVFRGAGVGGKVCKYRCRKQSPAPLVLILIEEKSKVVSQKLSKRLGRKQGPRPVHRSSTTMVCHIIATMLV